MNGNFFWVHRIMSMNAGWKYILDDKPKYIKSWTPTTTIQRIPNSNAPPDTTVHEVWTSPYATNEKLMVPRKTNNNNKNKNKKYTTAVVHSETPLTAAQHNRLLNRLKNVTAV